MNYSYFCDAMKLNTREIMKTKILLSAILLIGALFTVEAADHVKGNGKLTTKKIAISDYNSIKIDGVIDFNYEQSDAEPYIEITVDENLHEYVSADIKDRELSVGFKGVKVDHYTKFVVRTNSKWLKEVKAAGNANFMVNSPLSGDELKISANSNCLVQLKEAVKMGKVDLNVSGSANMVAAELEADKLECSITGSGTINLKKGNAKEGEYSIASNGEIMAFGVAVPELSCKLTGNGTMEVHATNNLKISIVGKGTLRYKGPTAVQQKIIGKGTVEEVK